jgi:hypothetical protein
VWCVSTGTPAISEDPLAVLGRVATCCGSGKALDVAPYGTPTVRDETGLASVGAFDLADLPGFVVTLSTGLVLVSDLDAAEACAFKLGTLLLFRIVDGF